MQGHKKQYAYNKTQRAFAVGLVFKIHFLLWALNLNISIILQNVSDFYHSRQLYNASLMSAL